MHKAIEVVCYIMLYYKKSTLWHILYFMGAHCTLMCFRHSSSSELFFFIAIDLIGNAPMTCNKKNKNTRANMWEM